MIEIGDYISDNLKSPKDALNILNKIQETVDKLIDFPLMGPLLSNRSCIESNYRFLVSSNYYIFYLVEADIIYISRILYCRRDYMTLLFGDNDFGKLHESE